MVEISVIVPVYNVEDYLSQCLDSIASQSFGDIEIICVDDGSDDNSLEILNDYAKRDSRIKVISQSNQGLGAARNEGLKNASGRYVFFIDSDDCIDSTTLEKLHDNASLNDSDIVLYKFLNFDDNNNLHKRAIAFKIEEIFGDIDYSNFTFTYKDAKRFVLNSAFSACLKLYKKEFLDNYDDFYFTEGIAFEDVLFHAKVMIRASRISFVPEFLYYYRSNPDSILNTSKNGFYIFDVIDSVEEFLRDNGHYDEFENEFIFFKIAQIVMYLISTRSCSYFDRAKEEFSKTVIKDEKTIKKYAVKAYYRVLSSDNYVDYLINYYEYKVSKLENRNKRLSNRNKQLEEDYDDVLKSSSWKVTKPLRAIKNFKK